MTVIQIYADVSNKWYSYTMAYLGGGALCEAPLWPDRRDFFKDEFHA